MKISKILISLSLATCLLFGACSKNENTIPNDNASNYSDDNTLKAPDGMKSLYAWPLIDEDTGQIITWIVFGCAWPASNCLPEVVIVGGTTKSSDLLNIVYDDFINKFNSNRVNEFFTTGDYLALFPQLINMPDVVKGLSESSIILHHEVGSEDKFDYYIGLSVGTNYLSNWEGNTKCVFVIDKQSE